LAGRKDISDGRALSFSTYFQISVRLFQTFVNDNAMSPRSSETTPVAIQRMID
jgi:hypothetical protein